MTGRPDPDRDAEEAERLVATCDGITVDGLTFSLEHVWRGEAVLRVAGGADERVTDTDAFFRDRHPVLRPQALVPDAERTARAAEAWSREVMRRLEGERFNVITLKWWGRPRHVPTFAERHGLDGTFVASSAFLRGLARAVGLEARAEAETDDAAGDLRGRVQIARERLDAGDTFVFCHVKSADAAGHTKDPQEEAGDDRDARRGARRSSDRSSDRVPHRRPRDAGVARRHPLGRPGAADRRRAGRARRRACASSASRRAPGASSGTCAVPT